MDNIGTLRYTGLKVKHERHSDNEYSQRASGVFEDARFGVTHAEQDLPAEHGTFDARHKGEAKTHAKKAREEANKLDGDAHAQNQSSPRLSAFLATWPRKSTM
jgi:hypothetical protein